MAPPAPFRSAVLAPLAPLAPRAALISMIAPAPDQPKGRKKKIKTADDDDKLDDAVAEVDEMDRAPADTCPTADGAQCGPAAAAPVPDLQVPEVAMPEGPAPELAPSEVVVAACEAFQRGGSDDIEYFWRFVQPEGELDLRYDLNFPMFRVNIRREPRYQGLVRHPCAALLLMRSYAIVGSILTDADEVVYRVKASPFFEGAEWAESDTYFQFKLVRQRPDSHPDSAAMLGERANCWVVHDIVPDFGSWTVHNPNNAESNTPDFLPEFLRKKAENFLPESDEEETSEEASEE